MNVMRRASDVVSPVGLPRVATEDERKALDATRRALPMQRLIGNGMEYSDAVAIHAMAEEGVLWPQAAAWLGDGNLQRVHAACAAANVATARSYYLFASACYRFGQSALIRDDAAKELLYSKGRDAFASAMRLAEPPGKRVEVPFGTGTLSGWQLRPSGVDRPPVVMIFGGADGWREEYHSGAEYLLQRGVGALLIDGPGQGESRIVGKVYAQSQPERAYSAVVEAVLRLPSVGPVGTWGNSLGGCFAARTAAHDPRLAACCVNGGSARPVEVLDRFPRFIERICAMLGQDDHQAARDMLAGLEIEPSANRISCPLLVLHGGQDRIFLLENAKSLYDAAPTGLPNFPELQAGGPGAVGKRPGSTPRARTYAAAGGCRLRGRAGCWVAHGDRAWAYPGFGRHHRTRDRTPAPIAFHCGHSGFHDLPGHRGFGEDRRRHLRRKLPILINCIDAVRAQDPMLSRVARSICLTRQERMWLVDLPAAMPRIIAGVRISLGISILLAVLAEMLLSTDGLGAFITQAQESFETANVLAALLVIALVALTIGAVARSFESRIVNWHLIRAAG